MVSNHWLRATIVSAAATVGLTAPSATVVLAQANNGPPAAASETVQREFPQTTSVLRDPNAPQDARDEAARRLVLKRSDEARQVLRGVLEDISNRDGQLAVARALAADPQPQPQFIDPLFALLPRTDRGLSEAAAQALANYKGNPDVFNRLSNFATARDKRDAVRVAAIKAIGTLVDKRAAEILMGLLLNTDESTTIRNGAADALVAMTGLLENNRDVQRWEQWWAVNGGKNEADWKVDLLYNRAARFDQLQTRYTELLDELQNILAEQYQLAPDVQKPEVVRRYLDNPVAGIRAVGAHIIYMDATNAKPIPTAAKERLREMVGDSSPEVRLEVAKALRAINDAGALEALLAQLAQEENADVRAELARAIAPIRDLRAVPELLKLLRDASFRAAEAAADALRQLGPTIREQDPDLARRTARDLRDVMDARAAAPGSATLREAIVEAMVPLREPALLELFQRLLRPGESARIRRAALRAIGELGESKAADSILQALEDPEPLVRLEAVNAMQKIATFEHAGALYARMNPQVEPNAQVQARAWEVLQSLFGYASREQLADWADRFRDQPDHRLIVLLKLRDQLVKENDEEQLAIVRQNIGETFMKLGKPGDAVPHLRLALDYKLQQKVGDVVTIGLIEQLMDALLKDKQFREAALFASEQIRADASHQQTMGPRIRAEAERLRDAGDLKNAIALIQEAERMSPPLDGRYLNELTAIRDEIRRRLAEQGMQGAVPPMVSGS